MVGSVHLIFLDILLLSFDIVPPTEVVSFTKSHTRKDASVLMLIEPPTGTPARAPIATDVVPTDTLGLLLVVLKIFVSSRRYIPVSIQIFGFRNAFHLNIYWLLDADNHFFNSPSAPPPG